MYLIYFILLHLSICYFIIYFDKKIINFNFHSFSFSRLVTELCMSLRIFCSAVNYDDDDDLPENCRRCTPVADAVPSAASRCSQVSQSS